MRFLPSSRGRREFGEIASEYDLVYFGNVDPQLDSDYKMVKGLTVAPDARDENYTTGDVYDYEVAFLQRSRKVRSASGKRLQRRWTILQVQLHQARLPHFLVDGRTRSREYGELLASTQRWREIGWQHVAADANFPRVFATYAQPSDVFAITHVLTHEVQNMMATYFPQFDYEFDADKVIIYATNAEVDLQLLDHMLRVGLWLARHFDSQVQQD